MTTEEKLTERLAEIRTLAAEARAEGVPDAEVFTLIGDCRNALKRARNRARAVSGEYERVELVPAQGPVVEFTGHLLRSDEFDTAAGKVRLEVWQTEAGALVAVDSFDDGESGERIKVCTPTGGIQEQRMAVMEFFRWGNRARSMARKLDWSIRRDVE